MVLKEDSSFAIYKALWKVKSACVDCDYSMIVISTRTIYKLFTISYKEKKMCFAYPQFDDGETGKCGKLVVIWKFGWIWMCFFSGDFFKWKLLVFKIYIEN